MILGIHHVSISVPDMKTALAFYCGVLGFEDQWGAAYEGDSPLADRIIGLDGVAAEIRMLKAGNAFIELWQYANPKPAPRDPGYPASDHGIAHFCLQVQDIEAEHARLSAAGMIFVGPPVGAGDLSAVYGRDPFGNIIEIFEIRKNAVPGIAA